MRKMQRANSRLSFPDREPITPKESREGLPWTPPRHCHACGTAYPWTQARTNALADAIDELEELSDEERQKLRGSIPDIIADTPKSETAGLRFKKAIQKMGAVGGKVLESVLVKVATEAVKGSMGI